MKQMIKKNQLFRPAMLLIAILACPACGIMPSWATGWFSEEDKPRILKRASNPDYTYRPPMIRDDLFPTVSRLIYNMNMPADTSVWENAKREIVYSCGAGAVPHLLFFLDKKYIWNTPAEKKIIQTLVDIGYPAVPEVKKCLKAKNRQTRQSAVKILMRIGDARVVNDLCDLWKDDPDLQTRILLMRAFVRIPSKRALKLMIEALDDPELGSSANKALQVILNVNYGRDKSKWHKHIRNMPE